MRCFFSYRDSLATWLRLAPFFRLTGRVIEQAEMVQVELHPFNDRQLNRDLAAVCARVNELQPRLPDGRRLLFTMHGANCLIHEALVQHACTGYIAYPF